MKIFIMVILFSSIAYADYVPKYHNTETSAMGYADVWVSGPANRALDLNENEFKALNLDASITLSKGLDLLSWGKDIVNFKDSVSGYMDLLNNLDTLKDLLKRSKHNLGVKSRLDLMKFSFVGKRQGYISIGMYSQMLVGTYMNGLRVEEIEKWEIKNDHIDLGKKLGVVSGKGIADSGIELEYGYPFEVLDMKLGVGIKHRVFYRVEVPLYSIYFNRMLYGENDIEVPELIFSKKMGFGTDIFTALDFDDQYVGGRVGLELRNVLSFSRTRDNLIVGLGGAIHPLRYLGVDALVFAMDLEIFEDDGVGVQSGASWKFGEDKYYLTPSVGFVMVGRDMWGDNYRSFTTGLSTKLFVLEVSGMFEYFGNGRYDVGGKIGLSW